MFGVSEGSLGFRASGLQGGSQACTARHTPRKFMSGLDKVGGQGLEWVQG